jgi:hypothetical protein
MNSPREIDQAIAAIYRPQFDHINTIHKAGELLRKSYVKKNPARVAALEAGIAASQAALEAIRAEAAPLEAIYKAKPWTRSYLVGGGHLHRSTYCSSLRWNTRLGWLTEYSGNSEAEIVALAGESCCTICYPSAPVNRPSQLPVHVKAREEAAAEAAEKAAQRKAAAAQAITVGRTTYKTTRGAENEISREIDTMISRRYQVAADAEHRAHLDALAAEDEAAARAIADALAAQIEGYDAAAVLGKKFAAKIKEYRKYEHYSIPADASL